MLVERLFSLYPTLQDHMNLLYYWEVMARILAEYHFVMGLSILELCMGKFEKELSSECSSLTENKISFTRTQF